MRATQFLALEFDDEQAARRALDHLWRKVGITGETTLKPQPGGGWLLEVVSEKPLRAGTLEKIGGRPVE